MSIFGGVAPLLNPFGLMRGIGRAAHDVFAPPPPMNPAAMNIPQAPMLGPAHGPIPVFESQDGTGPMGEPYGTWFEPGATPERPQGQLPAGQEDAMFRTWTNMKDAGAPVEDFEFYSRGLGPLNAASLQQTLPPPPADDGQAGQQWNALFDKLGLNPQPMQPMGGLSAAMGGPTPVQPNPVAQPSQMDMMRARYMQQFGDAGDLASGNLNYLQQDLNRRSARDRSDDFFGSVLAPTLGGMSKRPGDMAQLNQMGQGYMDQAQARRGERMNLVNTLVGRQNKAADFLQATDPQAFANQMKLMKAQTDFFKASNQGSHWDRQDQTKKDEMSYKEKESASRNLLRETQRQYYDSRIKSESAKMDEMVMNGKMTRAVQQATIKRWENMRDEALKRLEQEHDRMFMMDANADADRASRETIAGNAQTNAKEIATMNNEARANINQNTQEHIDQRMAGRLGSKGKPIMSQAFRNIMQVDPAIRATVQHQVSRYNSLPPGPQRAAVRQAIKDRYGYDPGE